jgi:hypothetical protein
MRSSILATAMLTVVLICASTTATSATSPQWIPSHAIEATSVTDGTHVVTAAVVNLRMCYEAQMQPWRRMKFDYVALEARVPGTEHKLCGQAIRKAVISITESGSPSAVALHTADGDQKLNVSKAGAIVTF